MFACWSFIDQLVVELPSISENGMMVRAFDGCKSVTVGEVDLTLEIGPFKFKVPFIVIDIPATFNMLLGHPCIHIDRAITSGVQ